MDTREIELNLNKKEREDWLHCEVAMIVMVIPVSISVVVGAKISEFTAKLASKYNDKHRKSRGFFSVDTKPYSNAGNCLLDGVD